MQDRKALNAKVQVTAWPTTSIELCVDVHADFFPPFCFQRRETFPPQITSVNKTDLPPECLSLSLRPLGSSSLNVGRTAAP